MITGIIIALIWIIGAFIAYKYIVSKWANPKWENIMISISWPCMIPLWIIHKIHNSL